MKYPQLITRYTVMASKHAAFTVAKGGGLLWAIYKMAIFMLKIDAKSSGLA